LTLVEVMIAMVIFTIGALGLAAASAWIVRQMALNGQRAYAASAAGVRSERFHSGTCGSGGSGAELRRGLRLAWSVEPDAGFTRLDHRITRQTPFGLRTDRFMSGVICQ